MSVEQGLPYKGTQEALFELSEEHAPAPDDSAAFRRPLSGREKSVVKHRPEDGYMPQERSDEATGEKDDQEAGDNPALHRLHSEWQGALAELKRRENEEGYTRTAEDVRRLAELRARYERKVQELAELRRNIREA